MIKNDRQYRLTKAQVRSFIAAVSSIDRQAPPAEVDPGISEIQKRALRSQLEEMSQDLKEYEALKSGKVTSFDAQSLADLPTLLVKARIARGLTQKDLANSLKVKEQQVQRWEVNDYSGASIETLKAVANALKVEITQQVFVPATDLTPKQFLRSLTNSGLGEEFLLNRIFPSRVASAFRDEVAGYKEIVSSASSLARVYSLKVGDLLTKTPPRWNVAALAATRFKLPARANKTAVDAYTLYAHYLSAVLVDCVITHATNTLPASAHDFHVAVTAENQPMTFERVARFLWSCGVIVLPLRDAGGFHGAVWKIKGRLVVVLKQATQLESRWLYDCLHETGHIENGDITEDIALIEEQEISPDIKTDIEAAAKDWAEDVIFDRRSVEIEKACTKACGGRLQKLKSVLPNVAHDFNVNLGSLANHMAFRLAEEGENWWGAAKNLQLCSQSPFSIAREVLLENVSFAALSEFDRELLQRALADE
jgi:transcriptional regulator with XRE-family HTH domain